jgi:MoxR-like ATPase
MPETYSPVPPEFRYTPAHEEELTKLNSKLAAVEAVADQPVKERIQGLGIDKKLEDVRAELWEQEGEKQPIFKNERRGYVKIGRERFPIAQESEDKRTWQIEGKQFREKGKTFVEVMLRRDDGMEIVPGGKVEGKRRFEDKDRFWPLADYKAVKKELPRYLKAVKDLGGEAADKRDAAEAYLRELREKHPDQIWALQAVRHLNAGEAREAQDVVRRDPYFVETPHVIESLQTMTRLIRRQLESKRGILVLEGDAGTGKNKLVDHFGYLTDRPVFRFTCSIGKDEQDLKYLLEYDPEKGTTRIKSTVVEALQTPNAILEFDELNTLKAEVAKGTLNPLFDADRTLFLGEERGKVTAAEGVIFIGLQNPQHYVGIEKTPETIVSRSRVQEVGYPPFEEVSGGKKLYRADEAMILRHEIPELKTLTDREFVQLWNAVVNKTTTQEAADLITGDRQTRVTEIREIVEIANKVREAYRKDHEGEAGADKVDFVFSLRDSIECAYELGHTELTDEEKKRRINTRAKKAIREVILPKVPRGEERTYLAAIIGEV